MERNEWRLFCIREDGRCRLIVKDREFGKKFFGKSAKTFDLVLSGHFFVLFKIVLFEICILINFE